MKRERSRILLWLAIVPTSVVTALVAAHFSNRSSAKSDSKAFDLSAYMNHDLSSSKIDPPRQPSLTAKFTDATMPYSKDDPSGANPIAPNSKPEMTSILSRDKDSADDSLKRVPHTPRVRTTDFPFQVVPFDAPVAEFPLVLVRQREVEAAPIDRIDGGFGAGDSMSYMRNNIYRVPGNPPGQPPGKPPGKPPVESNAGL